MAIVSGLIMARPPRGPIQLPRPSPEGYECCWSWEFLDVCLCDWLLVVLYVGAWLGLVFLR
jgi:hypothetical protein